MKNIMNDCPVIIETEDDSGCYDEILLTPTTVLFFIGAADAIVNHTLYTKALELHLTKK